MLYTPFTTLPEADFFLAFNGFDTQHQAYLDTKEHVEETIREIAVSPSGKNFAIVSPGETIGEGITGNLDYTTGTGIHVIFGTKQEGFTRYSLVNISSLASGNRVATRWTTRKDPLLFTGVEDGQTRFVLKGQEEFSVMLTAQQPYGMVAYLGKQTGDDTLVWQAAARCIPSWTIASAEGIDAEIGHERYTTRLRRDGNRIIVEARGAMNIPHRELFERAFKQDRNTRIRDYTENVVGSRFVFGPNDVIQAIQFVRNLNSYGELLSLGEKDAALFARGLERRRSAYIE